MHDPILNQGQWLRQVVTGFFAYHAVPTNLDAPAAFRYHIMVLWMRMLTRRSQKDRAGWDRPQGVAGLLRAAWLRPKQTDLVPGKGQFRSRFPYPLRYCCPTTIFLDPQPTSTSSQRNTSGRAGWKRLGPVVTMRSRSLGRRVSECWL